MDNQNRRLLPIHAGILVTFALVPIWLRLKPAPGSFHPLYSTGFVLFWPVVWTIAWWIIRGLPGFGELRKDRVRCWWALALMVLVCWAFLSWSWAYTRNFRPEIVAGNALPFALSALFALVVACARPSMRWIVTVLVIGLLVNSLVAGWQVARQGPISDGFLGEFNIDPAQPGVGVVQADGVRWLRPYGFLPHPNMLAGYLTVGCLAALAWVLSKERRLRWVGTVIFLIGLWGLMLTFSRAAWLGFAAGGFALLPFILHELHSRMKGITGHLRNWFTDRTIRHLLFTMGLAVIFAGAFFVLYRPFLAARAGEGAESIEVRSVSDRMVYTDLAYRAIEKSPILGVGIGNFPWLASYYLSLTDFDLRGQPAHHVFLSAWAELGFVGFLLTTGVVMLGMEAGFRAMKKSDATVHKIPTPQPPPHPKGTACASSDGEGEKHPLSNERAARAVMLAGVVALMVIGLLDHYPWTLMHFQVLWFGMLAAAGKPD